MRHELGCEYNMPDCDGNIRKLVPLWLQAGINVMFPYTDHRVPPDVSLDNFLYYRRRKCQFIGKECDEGSSP